MSVFLHVFFNHPDKSFLSRVDKHFVRPAAIEYWAVVIFDNRFSDNFASEMVKSIVGSCRTFGKTLILALCFGRLLHA
jgi:hypothetical protein